MGMPSSVVGFFCSGSISRRYLPDDAQWWGRAVVIEPRYVGDIAQGMANSGLQLTDG